MRSIPTGTALVLLSWACLAAMGALAPAWGGSSLGSRISAGGSHTCGVTSAFRAKCWGNNLFGQLGDGTKIGRLFPVKVKRLDDVPQAGGISGGSSHTCALVFGDNLELAPRCWGANSFGQLGDGTTEGSVWPRKVRGLGPSPRVPVLVAGAGHSCALLSNDVLGGSGEVWCWGRNDHGQLGDGTKTNRLKAVKVKGLTRRAVDIAVGNGHTCALTKAGRVECWGNNDSGQLGDGTKVSRLEPDEVLGLKGVTSITAGSVHTCARTSGAVVKCWGYNGNGQLGDGTTELRLRPVKVRGLTEGAFHVAAGQSHTCAVTMVNGAAMCWGRNNLGQLGDGTTLNREKPRYVKTLKKDVTAITAGGFHTCALKDDRVAKCWGSNSSGQLGDGTKTSQLMPVSVVGFK